MIMTKRAGNSLLWIALLVISIACESNAQEEPKPITVVGAHLEGRLDNNPASGYNQLIPRILPEDRSVAVYQRYPLVRALRDFEQTDRACLFPASIISTVALTAVPAGILMESDMVDYVSSHIMTRKGGVSINEKADVFGRTIAVQRGVVYIELMEDADRFTVIRTPDDRTALRMLAAGRVDGMYGWYPDALIIASNNGIELPDFNPDYILFETTTHVVCKKGIGAEPLIEHINRRLTALRDSGELQTILGPYARLEK